MTNAPSDVVATSAGRSVARVAQEPHQRAAIDRAVRDLDLLAGHVVVLAGLRDPDARRPWREPSVDPIRRAELDYAARIERAEANEEAPGEHPDAARPDVLDLLSAVLTRSVALADHVSRAAWAPVLPAPHADGDPRPYLHRAARYLPTAVMGWENGGDIAWWAADEAAVMLGQVEHALSLVSDGQRLKIICPWCDGRTEMAPAGGQRTWRVRTMPTDLLAIVCEGICEPPPGMSSWWRSQPCWPIYEWDWLATQVEAAEQRAKQTA